MFTLQSSSISSPSAKKMKLGKSSLSKPLLANFDPKTKKRPRTETKSGPDGEILQNWRSTRAKLGIPFLYDKALANTAPKSKAKLNLPFLSDIRSPPSGPKMAQAQTHITIKLLAAFGPPHRGCPSKNAKTLEAPPSLCFQTPSILAQGNITQRIFTPVRARPFQRVREMVSKVLQCQPLELTTVSKKISKRPSNSIKKTSKGNWKKNRKTSKRQRGPKMSYKEKLNLWGEVIYRGVNVPT